MQPDDGRSPQGRPASGRLVPEKLGLSASFILFAVPALLLWFAARWAVPALIEDGFEPLIAWFLAAGLMVFLPLLVAALAGARAARPGASVPEILDHLRVRPVRGPEWQLAGTVLVATIAVMALIFLAGRLLWPDLEAYPPFLRVEPIRSGQATIFALCLPFFFLNIVGEELWWRGFIQPRQEPVFGNRTYLVQAALHGLFHLSFGFAVLWVLWPALIAIPWAVQRSRNTSLGMIVHAGVSGAGLLAVSLGLLSG